MNARSKNNSKRGSDSKKLSKREKEIRKWTLNFINRYRKALEALADK